MNAETIYLNILYNRGNIITNVNKYLKMNSGDGYLKLSRQFFNNDRLLKVINYSSFYSNDFENIICNYIDLDKLGLNKIALFYSSLVSCQADIINSFIRIRDQFESQLLLQQYEKAFESLCEVYKRYGLSLWLIDAYSIVLNLKKSTESNDELSHLRDNSMFKLLAVKNNLKMKHNYYVKQTKEILSSSDIDKAYFHFLKYLLFVSVPNTKEEWKNILLYSTCFSFIDMYLCLIDYLQRVYGTGNVDSIIEICERTLDCIDDLRLGQIKSIQNNPHREKLDFATVIVNNFNSNNYDQVIKDFYLHKNNCANSISAYVLTAISYLFIENTPCQEEFSLINSIIESMYHVLIRDESTIDDVLMLATISRVFRIITIHKGLCCFLDIMANTGFNYSLNEMYSTQLDFVIKKNEDITDNVLIIPYLIKRKTISNNLSDKYLCFYKSKSHLDYLEGTRNYFQEGFINIEFNRLLSINQIDNAISLFVNSYINNKLLVYLLDISKIESSIKDKIMNRIALSINDICYLFIDSYMIEYRDDSFLELFDSINSPFPIELINNAKTTNNIKNFFLFEICTIERLSSLYFMFLSGEKAEDYRLKICNKLIDDNTFLDKKSAMDEIERITKRRMLSKRIRKIDESKLIINADELKEECHDYIMEKIDLYNNSPAVTLKILNKYEIQIIDNRQIILESIYNTYCKEFCFGNAGLDISLSTRVRHGTLSNQLLKIFSDHDLLVDGNKLNDSLQNLANVSNNKEELLSLIKLFNEKVNRILDYFVKNILKVYIDTPIAGAVFDYRYKSEEYSKIFGNIPLLSRISFDEVTSLVNYYIVEKTNRYLNVIRKEKLTALEKKLLDELDGFSKAISDHFLKQDVTKTLESKIVTCKTEIQNKLQSISDWFVLTEYNQWDPFDFNDIIQTCIEINKNMFSGYDNVRIDVCDNVNNKIKGKYFREFIDVILIIFNNAIEHSGYKDDLAKLNIECNYSEDSDGYYLSFENILSEDVDINELQKVVDRINRDFYDQKYLQLNVRQEGGMGLYKIMHIVFSVLKIGKDFLITLGDNTFRIELKLKKEISE